MKRLFFVGVAGFEPATSTSQTWRDNRATLHPELVIFKESYNSSFFNFSFFFFFFQFICDRDRIRTCDRLLRRQMLYPTELRDPITHCGEEGIRTPGTRNAYNSLAGSPIRPLWHLSFSKQTNLVWNLESANVMLVLILAKYIFTFLNIFSIKIII